jgi:hypothetical protein
VGRIRILHRSEIGPADLLFSCAWFVRFYDYSHAQHFDGKIIPGKFTITQSGKTIIEAWVESLGDVSNIDASVFNPAGLKSLGRGPAVTPPWTFHSMAFTGKPGVNPEAQFVVLHGMILADGRFAEPGSTRQFGRRPESASRPTPGANAKMAIARQ